MDEKILALEKFLDEKAEITTRDDRYYTVNERKVLEGYSADSITKTAEDFRSILPKPMASIITKVLAEHTPKILDEAYNTVNEYLASLRPKAKKRLMSKPSFPVKETKLDIFNRLEQEHLYIENVLFHILKGDSDYAKNLRRAWIEVMVDDLRHPVTRNDGEYLVLTDEEANELVEESLRNLFEEMTYSVDSWLRKYLDEDQYLEDNKGDRGDTLADYDGKEHEVEFFGTTYFIYRVN